MGTFVAPGARIACNQLTCRLSLANKQMGARRIEMLQSIAAYTLCSATMLLINKLVMHAIPLPSFVSVAQFASSCIAVFIAWYTGTTTIERFRYGEVLTGVRAVWWTFFVGKTARSALTCGESSSTVYGGTERGGVREEGRGEGRKCWAVYNQGTTAASLQCVWARYGAAMDQ